VGLGSGFTDSAGLAGVWGIGLAGGCATGGFEGCCGTPLGLETVVAGEDGAGVGVGWSFPGTEGLAGGSIAGGIGELAVGLAGGLPAGVGTGAAAGVGLVVADGGRVLEEGGADIVRPGNGRSGGVGLTGGSMGGAPGLAEICLPFSLIRTGLSALTRTGCIGGRPAKG
jgi:hypothetical protein